MARVRLRRAISGDWLHQDVPIELAVTRGVNGKNKTRGTIPAVFDVPAPDGLPLWLERSTVVYVDDDEGELSFVGLCSHSDPGRSGRQVEFGGLTSVYDLMPYDSFLSAWQPDPYDVVEALMFIGAAQPSGILAPTLIRNGAAASFLGDEMPPTPRPVRPVRNTGESRDDYQDRVDDWQAAADFWDATYSDRKPYTLAWYDHSYIGEEIERLAESTPFELADTSSWVTPGVEASLSLTIGPVLGEVRNDIALVQGLNLMGDIAPSTADNVYANDVWTLGAGDGLDTRLGRATVLDQRVRTTRFFEERGVTDGGYLAARAAGLLTVAQQPAGRLATARARPGSLPGLRPGDTIPVRTDLYTGPCRVLEVTASTKPNEPIELTFDTGES